MYRLLCGVALFAEPLVWQRLGRLLRRVETLWPQRQIEKAVFVGTAATRFAVAAVPPEAHERSLVIHGEADDVVPLSDVMNWARPQILPVTVIPDGAHFFHGQLPLLKGLVMRHLSAVV